MKSVIHIADYAPTYSGNFIASLQAAAAECRARGLKVVWVFPDDARDFEWFKQLTRSPDSASYTLSRSDGVWRHTARIIAIARAEDAAIVHTHFSRFDIAAWLAQVARVASFHPFRLFWHVHSAFPAEPGRLRRLKDFAKLGLMGRTCQIVPVSEALGQDVAARGCPRQRIHVVGNGIDIAHATERKRSRSEVREELNIPKDSVMLLGFGWTPARKGVDTMLLALAILRREAMNATLVVAGTEELRKFVAEWPDQSCHKHVRLIPPAEYVGELFGACDIFLSPSRAEGWCYAVAEAMVNEVPVAGCTIPTLNWAVNAPGVYLTRPANPEELAESVRRIAAIAPAQREQTGRLSAQFVRDRHSVQHWGQEIWSLYQKHLPPSYVHLREFRADGGLRRLTKPISLQK